MGLAVRADVVKNKFSCLEPTRCPETTRANSFNHGFNRVIIRGGPRGSLLNNEFSCVTSWINEGINVLEIWNEPMVEDPVTPILYI